MTCTASEWSSKAGTEAGTCVRSTRATAEMVWEYLDDNAFSAWRVAPFMVRCEMMGVCPMGLLDPEVSLDVPGPLRPQPFWQRPPAADPAEPFDAHRADHLAGRYVELLDDAVRLRLRADVRVGTALSGGLEPRVTARAIKGRVRTWGMALTCSRSGIRPWRGRWVRSDEPRVHRALPTWRVAIKTHRPSRTTRPR